MTSEKTFDPGDWFDLLDQGDQALILQRHEEFATHEGFINYLASGWELTERQAQDVENILGSKEMPYGFSNGGEDDE